MSSAKQCKFCFFLSNLDSFSFSCLIAVAMTSNIKLNKSGKSGHPCLVPDPRGNTFSFSPLSMMLMMDLSYGLYYVEVCSLCAHLLESFYHK